MEKLSEAKTQKSYDDKITLVCSCGKEFQTYKVIHDMKSGGEDLCYECRGRIRKEQVEKEKVIIDAQINKEKSEWRKNCGIAPKFQTMRFKGYEVTKYNRVGYSASVEYADEFPLVKQPYKSLGLISDGKWGVGKTHLASSIAHRVIDRWVGGKCPIYYVTEPQLFTRVRATFNKDGEKEEPLYHYLVTVPLLIIDDVGKEEVADPRFVQRVWFHIINGRYDNELPVVITANMSPDGIAHHLGGSRNNEATFDRLYEMLNGVFYEIGGESYRRRE